MEDSDQSLEEYLDKLGIKVTETKPMNTFVFDPGSKAIIVDLGKSDYEKLSERKSLFNEGSLLTTKEEITGFHSYDFKDNVAELYMKGLGPTRIVKDAILMVLKEGSIRSKFDLTSDWSMGLMAQREVESCFRTLKVLSIDKNNLSKISNADPTRATYFTILINPDYDIRDLKSILIFPIVA